MPAPAFLTAEWRKLVMLNFRIDPDVLRPSIPAGTALDFFEGRCLVSLVAFQFLNTRVKGLAVPGHTDFEEVNLRFYVHRKVGAELRRGVVFVKEIVPLKAVAWAARALYGENYMAMPMSHEDWGGGLAYHWGKQDMASVRYHGEPAEPVIGSEEEFVTEHYWGYVRGRDGGTREYQVEHPKWRVWPAQEATLTCDVDGLYGREFGPFLAGRPLSAFVAEGSAVTVRQGRLLRPTTL